MSQMQKKMGYGKTVEEAFESAVPAKSRGEGLKGSLERPARTRADQVADTFEGNTEGGWFSIPTAYVEARDFKAANELKGQRGLVFLFIKA